MHCNRCGAQLRSCGACGPAGGYGIVVDDDVEGEAGADDRHAGDGEAVSASDGGRKHAGAVIVRVADVGEDGVVDDRGSGKDADGVVP